MTNDKYTLSNMNYLQNIALRLQEVNNIISGAKQPKEVNFEQAMSLFSFYYDFQDTNRIIDEAEAMAKVNLDDLQNTAESLLGTATVFMSMDMTVCQAINYKTVFKQLVKPYEDEYETAKAVSTQLWRDYQAKSNRLDFLPFDSEEYKQLDPECDAAKTAYDNAHAKTDQLYEIFDEQQRAHSDVFCFQIAFLEVLVERIHQIVNSILLDIENLRKEGCV